MEEGLEEEDEAGTGGRVIALDSGYLSARRNVINKRDRSSRCPR